MLVKICGIDDPNLAKMALKAGADLIGVVLTPTSKRFVGVEKAITIVNAIREENSKPVLVFRHESFDVIASIADKLGDCVVQFQGEKRRDMKKLLSTFDTIVAFSVEGFDVATLKERSVSKKTMLMIDNQQPGSGKTFCWETLKQPDFPWFLAGGLHRDNVHQAMNRLKPTGVDVSTGVENSQGKKDFYMIEAFIKAVKIL